MDRVVAAMTRLLRKCDGQDLLEYAFLMALIAVVAIAGVSNLGNTMNNILWQTIANNF